MSIRGWKRCTGGHGQSGAESSPPRFPRRKASRQPACYAVRPRRVRTVALCLWCGASDGGGGGGSAAAVRETWPGAPPRPSVYPRRVLMPPRPAVLCAPKDFGEETAFDLISRLHHYIHESLRLWVQTKEHFDHFELAFGNWACAVSTDTSSRSVSQHKQLRHHATADGGYLAPLSRRQGSRRIHRHSPHRLRAGLSGPDGHGGVAACWRRAEAGGRDARARAGAGTAAAHCRTAL